MASRKKELRELKQPDQFVSFWSKVGSGLAARRRPLLVLAIACVVAVGLGQVVRAHLDGRNATRSRAFARIEGIANASLLPADGSTAAATDDELPHFKTDRERKEAAIKEAETYLAAYTKAPLRDLALAQKAHYLLDLGKAPDAVALYEELRNRAIEPSLALVVGEGLVHGYEAVGDLDKALAAADALAKAAEGQGAFFRDRALFDKARLLERKGSVKEAQAAYREVIEKYPTSALREDVNDRLASLEGK